MAQRLSKSLASVSHRELKFVTNLYLYLSFKFKASLGLDMPSKQGYCLKNAKILFNFWPKKLLKIKMAKMFKLSLFFVNLKIKKVLYWYQLSIYYFTILPWITWLLQPVFLESYFYSRIIYVLYILLQTSSSFSRLPS